jgi:hypothetical protein
MGDPDTQILQFARVKDVNPEFQRLFGGGDVRSVRRPFWRDTCSTRTGRTRCAVIIEYG